MTKKILIVGAGYMAREYIKVLKDLKFQITVVSRGLEKINELELEFKNVSFFSGGIENFTNNHLNDFTYAINTVNISFLKETTINLINFGIKNILIEKPGVLDINGLIELRKYELKNNVNISIAYNRRFYESVQTLIREAEIDGGILSLNFEFTEWIHTIEVNKFQIKELEKWIISNSSHVIDTVFHLIGLPVKINSLIFGSDKIKWHPSGSTFIGSGISEKNIPFSYHSNWESPGRWSIEVLTNKRRFFLKPMEKLMVQKIGSVSINEFPINNDLDNKYKPGLYCQTKSFVNKDFSKLTNLEQQINHTKLYNEIGGYYT